MDIWILIQESNVDGQIITNAIPCLTEDDAKSELEREKKTIMKEYNHYSGRDINDFIVEDNVTSWLIKDPCDDYYEYMNIVKKTLVENSHLAPLDKIKSYIGEGGCVAFEHGYKKPEFTYCGNKYIVTMIDNQFVHCYLKSLKLPRAIKLKFLAHNTLCKLYNAINDYERFCKEGA